MGDRLGERWPDGKRFAFTVFDDTDLATMENVPAVYELLRELGFRTTKTAWPLPPTGTPDVGGEDCSNPEYVNWLRSLHRDGFELAWHMAAPDTSNRERTVMGLDRFAALFGSMPRSMANHVGAFEGIYWGDARLGPVSRQLYNLLTRGRRRGQYRGHITGDPTFWGDLCKDRFRYVRNFTVRNVDTLRACPLMPYHDPTKPFVNYWFAATEGSDVDQFVRSLTDESLDRLEAQGGACVMYTHFGAGFVTDGRLDERFERVMRRIADRDGWFVPVSELLDHLLARNGHREVNGWRRFRLEARWFGDKLRIGST